MFWQDTSTEAKATEPKAPPKPTLVVPVTSEERKLTDLKVELHRKVLKRINLNVLEELTREQLEQEFGGLVQEMLMEEAVPLNLADRQQMTKDLLDELLGLGPLEPLLKDPSVSDILVNSHDIVFVERGGKLEKTEVLFKDQEHLHRIITKIVSRVGRRVDESEPMVDARLPDGSRVNAIIPPLAVDGAMLSIRKFAKIPINMDRLISLNTVPKEIAELLAAIVVSRRNVLISGGTGSGKTTMLNAMSAAIDAGHRIITIEDSAELQMQQDHVGRLETRPANMEGRGEVTQRELVKNALRMRPDRIIVGEVRGGEAFDMLQAMNTGHDGSMTTVHANSARDALARVEQMVGMCDMDISLRSVRAQIASAIQVVIQLGRLSDGSRRMLSLSEITGMEGDVITMQDVMRFERTHTDKDGTIHGNFQMTGIRPTFMGEIEARGVEMDADIFKQRALLEV